MSTIPDGANVTIASMAIAWEILKHHRMTPDEQVSENARKVFLENFEEIYTKVTEVESRGA